MRDRDISNDVKLCMNNAFAIAHYMGEDARIYEKPDGSFFFRLAGDPRNAKPRSNCSSVAVMIREIAVPNGKLFPSQFFSKRQMRIGKNYDQHR